MLGCVRSGIASAPVVGRAMNSHLKERVTMLYTIAVILLIAWLLGIVGTYTIGAFVHVLLVVAVVLFVVGLLSGRRSAGIAAWNRAA
jgi:asparagine N-glycosylation enzyme membrane subunit Stt3